MKFDREDADQTGCYVSDEEMLYYTGHHAAILDGFGYNRFKNLDSEREERKPVPE